MWVKKYVLTGGPGIGKTTVLELLSQKGYAIVPEAARMIVEEEKLKGSNALPTGDLAQFQRLVAARQLQLEENVKGEFAFCDRSLVDGYAYCKLGKVEVPQEILDLSKGRYDKIFLLAPLASYATDETRFEHPEVAMAIHKAIAQAYREFGYELVEVPLLPPGDRVDFICDKI